MIRLRITIRKYNWEALCYLAKTCYYTDEIIKALQYVGCSGSTLEQASQNLRDCSLNTGLTYSNLDERKTIFVVALTSTASEFVNSLSHEASHLRRHIERGCNIDPDSEEPCYLVGEFVQHIFINAHELMCPHCR